MVTTTDKTSSEEVQAIREDLKQLRTDVTLLARALKGEGGEKLGELRNRVSTVLHEKAETIRHGTEHVKHAAKEHPFTTALISLCLGMITGAMLRGRRE